MSWLNCSFIFSQVAIWLTPLLAEEGAQATVPEELLVLRPLVWDVDVRLDENPPYYQDKKREYRIDWVRSSKYGRWLVVNGSAFAAPGPGELLPLFGHLYRAEDNRSFTRVPLKEYPEGVRIGTGEPASRMGFRCIIPFEKKGVGVRRITVDSLNGSRIEEFRLISIERSTNADSLVAEVHQGLSSQHKQIRRLRTGDSFTVKGTQVKVCTIIPRDSKMKTIGWIEVEVKYEVRDKRNR